MWKFIAVVIAFLSIVPAFAGRGGSPLQNGFNNAPSGATPLAAGLFTNGTGGTGTNYLGSGGVRPPWPVPGVDYGVGFSVASNIAASCPTNGCDPATAGINQISAGCSASVNTTSHVITVNAAPCTIQNLDLSISNGYGLNIAAGCSGGTVLLSNNNIVVGSNHGNNDFAGAGIVNMANGSQCNVDFENNVIDGNGCNFGGADANTLGTIIGLTGGSSISVTAQYNQILNSAQHGIAFNTQGGQTWNAVVRYNYFRDFGYANGSHGDPTVNNGNGGSFNRFILTYNVISNVTVPNVASGDPSANGICAANQTFGGGPTAMSYFASNIGVVQNNVNSSNNVLITLNNSVVFNYAQSDPQGKTPTPVLDSNYIDWTGSVAVYTMCFAGSNCALTGGISPTITNNVHMTTGNSCNSNASCS